MKKNNKGMTLTELLVSIVMLSSAMVLMFGLMTNLQHKKSEVTARTQDIIRINDLEHSLQEYIMGPSNYGRYTVNNVNIKKIDSGVSITIDGIEHKIIAKENNTKTQSIIQYESGTTTEQWTFKEKECEYSSSSYTNNNFSYIIVFNCTSRVNDKIVDYIKIPLYFSSIISGNITTTT